MRSLKTLFRILPALACSTSAFSSNSTGTLTFAEALVKIESSAELELSRSRTRQQGYLADGSYKPYIPKVTLENEQSVGDRIRNRISLVGRAMIYDGGKTPNSISLQKSRERELKLLEASQKDSLKLSLIETYFSSLAFQMGIQVFEKHTKLLETFVGRAEKMFQNRALSEKDLLRLKVELLTFQQTLEQMKLEEKQKKIEVKKVVEVDSLVLNPQEYDKARVMKPWPLSLDETLKSIESVSLRKKIYAEQNQQLDYKYGVAKAEDMPKLSLEARQGLYDLRNGRRDTAAFLNVNFSLDYPFFMGPLRGAISEERSQLRIVQKLEERDLKDSVDLILQRQGAFPQFLSALRDQQKFAQKKWEIERALYFMGTKDSEELIAALKALRDIEIKDVNAVLQFRRDQLSLRVLCGMPLL